MAVGDYADFLLFSVAEILQFFSQFSEIRLNGDLIAGFSFIMYSDASAHILPLFSPRVIVLGKGILFSRQSRSSLFP